MSHPTLYKLFDGENIIFNKISQKSSLSSSDSQIAQESPCKDGKIYAIAAYSNYPEDIGNENGFLKDRGINPPDLYANPTLSEIDDTPQEIYPTLEIWDTLSGERTTIPIRLADGSAIVNTGPNMIFSNMTSESLRGNYLYWLHGNRIVIKTNILDGKSEIINRDLEDTENSSDWIQIQDNYMHIMHQINDLNNIHWNITTIDLDTGRKVHDLSLKEINKEINPDYHAIHAFATNPKFKEIIAGQ